MGKRLVSPLRSGEQRHSPPKGKDNETSVGPAPLVGLSEIWVSRNEHTGVFVKINAWVSSRPY